MSKIFKAIPSVKDHESINDDEFEDSLLLDENEELEQRFVPGARKESKRNRDAQMNKENKWKIRG